MTRGQLCVVVVIITIIYRYRLEGAAEHGDEHVDQDDDHDATVRPIHELAHELRELVLLPQLEMVDVDQTVDGEVQGLHDLE